MSVDPADRGAPGADAAAGAVAAAPPLRQLYVYLTDGCNLACRHCWIAPRFDPEHARSRPLPVALFEAALAEAAPLGLRQVKLTGGEPLLHPELLHLLEAVRERGLALALETNGMLCTPELAGRLRRFERCFVSVSLDGADAATHDAIRGVEGAFERACRGVRLLADAGLGPQIIMTVMRENLEQVEPMIRLAEALGAASIKFNLVQPTAHGEALHRHDAAVEVEQLIRLGRRVDLELTHSAEVRLLFDVPLAFRPLSRIARGAADCTCGVLGILGLLADGHWALCGMGKHAPGLVFGRVGRDPLARVWRSNPTLIELREGLPVRLTGVCAHCLMKFKCLGACVAQNTYRTGDLWRPYWFCELAEAAGLFPCSRSTRARDLEPSRSGG